jgi:predicted DNA-binding transcriptional regulator AlpA
MKYKPHLLGALASVGLSPEDLAGLAEIAELLGVTKATAQKYARRADFPEPLGEIAAAGRVWRRADVETWGKAKLPLRPGRPRKSQQGRR